MDSSFELHVSLWPVPLGDSERQVRRASTAHEEAAALMVEVAAPAEAVGLAEASADGVALEAVAF